MSTPKIRGGAGAVPPPHAPRETSAPLSTAELERQLRVASQNERQLAPFAPDPAQQGVVSPATGATIPPAAAPPAPDRPVISSIKPPDVPREPRRRPEDAVGSPSAAGSRPDPGQIAPDPAGAPPTAGDPGPAAPPIAVDPASAAPSARPTPAEPYRPAASDSDSPARGIPTPTADPGKAITGGFGAAFEAQYFPLAGDELALTLQGLLMQLAEQIPQDLRFTPAVVYPRVRARVEVIVESYAADTDFRITRVLPPHEKTPVEVARTVADEIVFVVVNQRQEFDADGNIESPANAIRAELGVQIPQKQIVETPNGRLIVDVRSEERS